MKKKTVLLLMLLGACRLGAVAQVASDSLHVEEIQEAVVNGVRVRKDAPFAVSNVTRTNLEKFSTSGKELPFLLSSTPGVLAWSDNGVGTGTSYLRIRGAGDSRINVTIDGVPLNSPEDQCVFWANMNSYSSLLESVQIQRGVGSSSNGDGAFGGTVSLKTKAPSYSPSAEFDASFGSFNTYNTGFSVSTGLLGKHFIVDGTFHTTGTDGYVHGTSGRSGSWMAGLSYVRPDLVIRYRNIGNFEHTGQAWNGVTAGTDDQSIMDGSLNCDTYSGFLSTGVKTYADLDRLGLGKYNSLYESMNPYTYETKRHTMMDGTPWARTTDNFWQDHNILSAAYRLSPYLKTSLSLHYTYGYGYYDEFRPNNKLSKFGFPSFTDGDGNKVKRTDFVRQKGLSQNTAGLVWNVRFNDKGYDFVAGIATQRFWGNHFGYLTYVANPDVAAKYGLAGLNDMDLADGRYQYYDSDAWKNDSNFFIKETYKITDHLSLFADVQLRLVGYRTDGVNDRFLEQEDGTFVNQKLDIDSKYVFFNPKAGVSYVNGGHHAYASVAKSSREPERNNFTDNGSYPAPVAETLRDLELGYQYNSPLWHAGINLYYMDYDNQFVQTGAKSDIGENLTTNIKDSYRAGAEMSAGVNVTSWLSIEGNAALSRNVIKDFDEYVEDWDNGETVIHYDNSTLAFSPSAILNGMVDLHWRGFAANWHTSYVSRQYLDNTANLDRSLPAYSLSGLSLTYKMQFRKVVKEAVFGLDVNNVFNARVAASGWVYSAIYESGGHANDNRYYQIGFVPVAGTSAMASVRLKF